MVMALHGSFRVTQSVQGALHVALRLEDTHQDHIAGHEEAIHTISLAVLDAGRCVLVGRIKLVPLTQQIGQTDLVGAAHPRIQTISLHHPLTCSAIKSLCLVKPPLDLFGRGQVAQRRYGHQQLARFFAGPQHSRGRLAGAIYVVAGETGIRQSIGGHTPRVQILLRQVSFGKSGHLDDTPRIAPQIGSIGADGRDVAQ